MKLRINFPKNLDAEIMLSMHLIPCIVKISNDFELVFSDPLVSAEGTVEEWSKEDINLRSPASGGGRYLHYKCAQVTLKSISEDYYEIEFLKFFEPSFGWLDIVEYGNLAKKGQFYDEDA